MPKWIIHLDTIDSTNNYAMNLIEDGMAQHGIVIWAEHQEQGKGQRGKSWSDHPGNLKISLILISPPATLQPFQLSMHVANILVKYLQIILPRDCDIRVKWPNDIYINDKKTCGILIENIFLSSRWTHAVIGIGLNVNQQRFPNELKNATSLKRASGGKAFDHLEIIHDLRSGIFNSLQDKSQCNPETIWESYQKNLYLKGKSVRFRDKINDTIFEAFVLGVSTNGMLILQLSSKIKHFSFGDVEWLLDK